MLLAAWRRIPLSWMVTFAFGWVLLIAAGFLAAQDDPFHGVSPHNIPHCSPAGDGKRSARCGCAGMVQAVNEAIALSCWEQAGTKGKPDKFLLDHPPKEVLQCMEANQRDHCQIVANAWQEQARWGVKADPKKQCRTSCKPQACGCSDSACKAHGAPGAGY